MKENGIRIVPIDPDNPEKGFEYHRFEGDEEVDKQIADAWMKEFFKEEADQNSADTEERFSKRRRASTKMICPKLIAI